MKKEANFSRTALITDRATEFLSEAELTTQFGYGKALWPLILTKELVDNSLDATETTNIAPQITVALEPDALTVHDNGPGLKPEIIERALDYHLRISDKKYYISPTRGQLGNALKCLWAAPFVANGEHSLIEVTAVGSHHRIEVGLDRVAQVPRISHVTTPSVKNGTCVKVHWKGIASLRPYVGSTEFYRTKTVADVLPDTVADFSAFNPHAAFTLRVPNGKVFRFPASDRGWRKWRTSQPTSAHWYRPEDLKALIAAYISNGNRKTVRDFIGEFDGLSGTQYRKRVLAEAGISASYLDDLVVTGDINTAAVEHLLTAMQQLSRPVKPQRLGVIGKEHLQTALVARGVASESFTYRKAVDVGKDGLPFVAEVAFGVRRIGPRQLIIGLNHSPIFKIPSGNLSDMLADCHVQQHDPVVLLVHMACPRFTFTDHGKGAIA